jgi:DnaA family protein
MVLPLQLQDHAVFESFQSDGNETLVAFLIDTAARQAGHGCWLWGAASTGKTHLLQASCALAGDRAVYLALDQFAEAGAGILDGMESRSLICLDNMDAVAGRADWERALFQLYNEVIQAGGAIVVGSEVSVRECGFELPDLISRFSQLPAFRLEPLDESGRVKALQLRASHRGLTLPEETANYLLSRSRRDMASLYDLLDKLDLESLKAQRRLTIPFVRSVFSDLG